MPVNTLFLQKFRNISSLALHFCPGINVILGENGAGKTAIVEALGLLVRGRSFRTPRYQDCIAHGADHFLLRAAFLTDDSVAHTMGVQRYRSGQSQFRIDGESTSKLSEGARLIPLQILLPTTSEMIFGGPGNRRQWVDWGVFHVEPLFLGLQREVTRLLKQRNAELRAIQMKKGGSLDTLAAWSSQLAQRAEKVNDFRVVHTDQIRAIFPSILKNLNPELSIDMSWFSGWPEQHQLAKLLVDGVAKEVKSATTHFGPHRADLILKTHGYRANQELSRGQGKLVAIALILAQAQVLQQRVGIRSVFLMDDIAAELDRRHRETLFGFLAELDAQIIVTSTDRGVIPVIDGQKRVEFHVKHGELMG